MFSCPGCGGNVKFDISSQKLLCDFCHERYDPYAFEDKKSDAEEIHTAENDFEATIFTCPQCGGEILSTDNSAAEFCSFCGASTILYSRLRHEKRPNFIIPFRKTKEDCKQAYFEFMKKAIFAPKELKDPKCIDSFRGIYMPYWAFYITQQGPLSVPAKKKYRQGNYLITDHYNLEGTLDAYYKGLSYDASSSFADNISETLAPYDLKGMQSFTPAYLSGFYADVADVPASVYQQEAEGSATGESIRQLHKQKQFTGLSINDAKAAPLLGTKTAAIDSTMFPVWFMSYRKRDRVAYVTINGQTGKISADVPVALHKYFLSSLLLSIPLFFFFMLFTLLPRTLVTFTFVLAILTLILYASELRSIHRKDTGADDRGVQYRNWQRKAGQPRGGSGTRGVIGCTAAISAIVVCALMLILHPVFDLYYYFAAILGLSAVGLCIWDLIRCYNILSTRRLPQFDRTGGDDRA